MFTGIVEHKGRVARIIKRGGGARLEVHVPQIMAELQLGDSVAVNGACVTVTEMNADTFAADLVPETVSRTTLGILQPDEEVNIERPMRASDRFGGHIVQGHVDTVGVVRSRRRVGAQEILEVTIPFELTRYLAPQGSVALDGVSLTVVAVDKERFRVALIPYTVEMTTLGQKVQGSSVNVEIDVLSKYVERHLVTRMTKPAYLRTVPSEPQPDPREAVVRGTAATKTAPKRPSRSRSKTAAAKKTAGKQAAPKRSKPKRPAASKPKASKTKTKPKPKGAKKKTTTKAATKKRSR